MKLEFRLTSALVGRIRADLRRSHRFAFERVGFISARPATTTSGLALFAIEYHPVADEDYVDDPSVGAMIGPAAMRKALQFAYKGDVSMLHVHMHEHAGPPEFSRVDLREYPKFVPDFFNVRPRLPHGAILLSHDELTGLIWPCRAAQPQRLDEASEIGTPLRIFRRTS
jgi:hypothetical protein